MGCRDLSYYQSEPREAKKKTPSLLRTVWRKSESSRSDVNYYPFGSSMPGRTYNNGDYRYGFNGMEKDDEIKGSGGSSYDFAARMYDSRLGRFLSLDRLAKKFPFYSPYLFAGNTPISAVDINGDELYIIVYDSRDDAFTRAGRVGKGDFTPSLSQNRA